ncbi:MAG: F0F1 ATP synthase subunit delta [Candidatus Peribacteraceae bacterium]|nr:F0F1 ATP synthase subunit delta [Candidatus Peribacteraceae bacterium]
MPRSDQHAVATALAALASVIPEKDLTAVCDRALDLIAASGSADFTGFLTLVEKALERSGQVVFATLATPTGTVSAERKTSIISALEKRLKKPVVLREAADPSLLGGARLTVGDDLYDLSLSGDLQAIVAA